MHHLNFVHIRGTITVTQFNVESAIAELKHYTYFHINAVGAIGSVQLFQLFLLRYPLSPFGNCHKEMGNLF
jgi:hypothetical protein